LSLFAADENDAKLLDEITKEDVLQLFMSNVHPSSKTRAKLSVHMLSQKPRAPRISLEAAEAFEALVREANLGIEDPSAWRDVLGEPPFEATALGQFWLQSLADKPQKEALLAAIPGLLKQFPVAGETADAENATSSTKDTTFIDDPAAFRASLKVSDDRSPMVEWGDLPLSNL
jgi:insulysin